MIIKQKKDISCVIHFWINYNTSFVSFRRIRLNDNDLTFSETTTLNKFRTNLVKIRLINTQRESISISICPFHYYYITNNSQAYNGCLL